MISACFQAGARFTRALEAEAALAGGEWRANSQSSESTKVNFSFFAKPWCFGEAMDADSVLGQLKLSV